MNLNQSICNVRPPRSLLQIPTLEDTTKHDILKGSKREGIHPAANSAASFFSLVSLLMRNSR